MTQDIIATITDAGGLEWKKYGKHRIYLDVETAYELAGGSISFYKTGNVAVATLPAYEEEHGSLSNRRAYVQSVYYDMADEKFHAQGTTDVVSCLVDQLTAWLDAQLSENPVYTMTVTHRPMQREDFTYTGTLIELVEQIEADVFSYEFSSGPELMAEIEATEDEAEELLEVEGLSVEPGQTLWILFDESKHIEKPEITLYLVKRYASHVYDAHIRNIFMEKINAETK
ncbi:hypothetical protein [uncultured Brevibacterium sp.]|jgi:hypothetical protein|uniref:hypothetical protein n=1 Tax=uncultured Brevibacterium sp. TaxID=189678 RepID=UPI0025D7D118|nr:hypothetical protein [uncultured Brevibacterium sp.]